MLTPAVLRETNCAPAALQWAPLRTISTTINTIAHQQYYNKHHCALPALLQHKVRTYNASARGNKIRSTDVHPPTPAYTPVPAQAPTPSPSCVHTCSISDACFDAAHVYTQLPYGLLYEDSIAYIRTPSPTHAFINTGNTCADYLPLLYIYLRPHQHR